MQLKRFTFTLEQFVLANDQLSDSSSISQPATQNSAIPFQFLSLQLRTQQASDMNPRFHPSSIPSPPQPLLQLLDFPQKRHALVNLALEVLDGAAFGVCLLWGGAEDVLDLRDTVPGFSSPAESNGGRKQAERVWWLMREVCVIPGPGSNPTSLSFVLVIYNFSIQSIKLTNRSVFLVIAVRFTNAVKSCNINSGLFLNRCIAMWTAPCFYIIAVQFTTAVKGGLIYNGFYV